jgi:Holliday junction DNA helicase RuvA
MIASLTGQLREKHPTHLIIDVNGVGYAVFASLGTYQQLPEQGESVTLLIHTNVREDDIVLFGFIEHREKQLFQKLIKVNGVGPRLALNILSGIATNELIQALRAEDTARITSIPGIGKKTAERIVLDLKDKLVDLQGITDLKTATSTDKNNFRDDLLSVLQNLGYKRGAAERALHDVALDEVSSLQEAVRLTLRNLGEQNKRQVS